MWTTITSDQVMSRLSATERSAIEAAQGEGDQLTQVLSDVVDTVRGNIIAGGNRLGPAGTTPDQLKIHVMAMAIWLWINSLSKNEKVQTPARQKNYDDAIATLKDVAAGKIKIEVPDSATAVDAPGPVAQVQVANKTTRQATRNSLKNL